MPLKKNKKHYSILAWTLLWRREVSLYIDQQINCVILYIPPVDDTVNPTAEDEEGIASQMNRLNNIEFTFIFWLLDRANAA